MAFFYDERKNLLVTVMLGNAFSTHVTALGVANGKIRDSPRRRDPN